MSDEQKKEGAFISSLKRNNKEIKSDRAEAIFEDAEIKYKRTIEDLGIEIKAFRRQQDGMLDMSPENALSLKLANNFDADEYVNGDLTLGIKIRNAEIKLEVAQKRFNYLFGGE